MHHKRFILGLCLAALILTPLAWALTPRIRPVAGQTACESKPAKPVYVRVQYDIRDLLREPLYGDMNSDVVAPGGYHWSRTSGEDYSRMTRKEKVGEICKAIINSIDIELRDGSNFNYGIREYNETLIVEQTPGNQAIIEKLLADLRSQIRRTLTLRMTWVLAGPGEIEKVIQPGSSNGISEVDLAALSKNPEIKIAGQGVITLPNGHRRLIASGRGRLILQDITPAGCRSVNWDPETEMPQDGLRIELQALQAPDGWTNIRLRGVVSNWNAPPVHQPFVDADPKKVAPEVDRVDVQIAELAATLTMPAGKPILICGATRGPRLDDKADLRESYLILEVVAVAE